MFAFLFCRIRITKRVMKAIIKNAKKSENQHSDNRFNFRRHPRVHILKDFLWIFFLSRSLSLLLILYFQQNRSELTIDVIRPPQFVFVVCRHDASKRRNGNHKCCREPIVNIFLVSRFQTQPTMHTIT